MRCRACDRSMEPRWWQPEGAESPILEDLCSLCLPWSRAALTEAEAEPGAAVVWPKAVALHPSDMLAFSEGVGAETSHTGFAVPRNVESEHDEGMDAP